MSLLSYWHFCWEIAEQQNEGFFLERHYPLFQNGEGKYVQWKDFVQISYDKQPPAFSLLLFLGHHTKKNAASDFIQSPASF